VNLPEARSAAEVPSAANARLSARSEYHLPMRVRQAIEQITFLKIRMWPFVPEGGV
jgi:hypothetical protein